MKFLTTFTAKNEFPRVLKLARREMVIVTNRGKPVAAIQGFRSEEDLEDYLIERSPRFWEAIERGRQGKGIPAEQVWVQLGIATKKQNGGKKKANR